MHRKEQVYRTDPFECITLALWPMLSDTWFAFFINLDTVIPIWHVKWDISLYFGL